MNRNLIINSHRIDDKSNCFVIAEIGHNHQGSIEKAKELFLAAKECGADAVKLQKRDNVNLYTKKMYDQSYCHENSFGNTYGEHREALEFGKEEYIELLDYAREIGIIMFATTFDFASTDFLAELNMPAYKIASGDLLNTPLLRYVAKVGKPVFVSTGGATMGDVQRAYDTIMPINPQLCLMQCTSGYPCETYEMNLKVIQTYREVFPEIVIGLSDHQNGISMATTAYILGARVIEKHFTLNHAWKGTDHAFSLEPIGMKKMIRDLRRVSEALGDGIKKPYNSEKKALQKMGKKLVASRDIKKGQKLNIEDVAIKSPNDGLPPCEIDKIIGKCVRSDIQKDENILFEDLE